MKEEEEGEDERHSNAMMGTLTKSQALATSDDRKVGFGEERGSLLDIKSLVVSQAW